LQHGFTADSMNPRMDAALGQAGDLFFQGLSITQRTYQLRTRPCQAWHALKLICAFRLTRGTAGTHGPPLSACLGSCNPICKACGRVPLYHPSIAECVLASELLSRGADNGCVQGLGAIAELSHTPLVQCPVVFPRSWLISSCGRLCSACSAVPFGYMPTG
jgi:hypothetical protein